MCSHDRVPSVQPSPADGSRAAAAVSRPRRPPPAGRFRKENGGVLASCSAIPMAMAAVAPGKASSPSSATVSPAPCVPPLPPLSRSTQVSGGAVQVPAAMALPAMMPVLWAAAAVGEEEDDEEELDPQTPPPVPVATTLPAAHPVLWVAAAMGEVEVEDQGVEELAPQIPPLASTLQATAAAPEPTSWASADNDDEDEDEEELAPRTPPSAAPMTCAAPDVVGGNVVVVASPMLLAAPNGLVSCGFAEAFDAADAVDVEDELALETMPATKTFIDAAPIVEERERDGWHEVMPRRGPRRSTLPAPPVARRPVPAWLKGRCCRCLVLGHRAAVCCDPFRCSRCLENGHRACDCRNAWRPISSLAGPTVLSPRQEHAPLRAQEEGSMTVSTTRKTRDPYIVVKARDITKLLARSVPAPQALKLLSDDDISCDIIKIGNIIRNRKRFALRRSRILGPNMSTLQAIEDFTGCYILVQGSTVSAMGSFVGLKHVRKIAEACIKNTKDPISQIQELRTKLELAKKYELAME
ncbi:uncharacterized protein [Lolium perenne]|uniref:uncharacterized protein isoform X1 n=1 Tax=Lolium perenne TaxID=4522 RepID=UPI0021F5851C|nr:uncharacterized protein LOC127296675 isoform X1 [Lolium perenne]